MKHYGESNPWIIGHQFASSTHLGKDEPNDMEQLILGEHQEQGQFKIPHHALVACLVIRQGYNGPIMVQPIHTKDNIERW
jgi:hypothetical protein